MAGVHVSHSEDFTHPPPTGCQLRLRPIRLSVHLVALSISVLLPGIAVSQTSISSPSLDARKQANSLFQRIERVFSPKSETLDSLSEKCGFRFQFDIRRYRSFLTLDQQAILRELFSRPTLQASILSPSARFRIHYDTTGRNTPAMIDPNGVRIPGTAKSYVDSVAAIFDQVWDFETRTLGYPVPPSDQGAAGGNEYDIYIIEFSRSLYGQTVFNDEDVLNSQRPNPTYMSYIEIDNDYLGYFSRGLPGLRVTAAHEFHHAIQVGNYGFWSGENDVYYYELTSTWMEDVVYDDVNDYYQYLPTYFNKTTQPFNLSDGYVEYGRSVWGHFIEKRFGRSVMKRSWEYLSSMRSLQAIDASLRERGTNFVRELPEFSLWHFYTGHRADPGTYFPEARAYPEVRPLDFTTFFPPTATISNTAKSLSIQFYQLAVDGGGGRSDTITMALTNINQVAAEQGDAQNFSFSYRFTNEPVDGSYELLRNALKVKLIVPDPMNWKSIALLNSTVNINPETLPYPNPFFAGKSGGVAFPIDARQRTRVTLNIYSADVSLICSKVEESTTQFGKQVVLWDGKDSNGKLVASGIYVYLIISEEKEYKGKIAVVKQ